MKVFKFGGASIKSAAAIRNMASIVQAQDPRNMVIVVSAMGKTTNALEDVLRLYMQGADYTTAVNAVYRYHEEIIRQLFSNPDELLNEVSGILKTIHQIFDKKFDQDKTYDQLVSLGEVISSKIVHQFLRDQKISCEWIDARNYIKTDSTFREGIVNWSETEKRIAALKDLLNKNILLTQGFIGSTDENFTTTLGREGSDFTAAIFASCLHAESVTIWKDVPGVMNADPKRLPAAVVFEELPFKEAAEMTYYGASVIHPKTIKPLALKNIPLLVKSFDNPSLPGTKIHDCHIDHLPPLIVFKDNQCLISCKVTDYTFVNEQQISTIFHALSELNMRINVMQNSAISFSFCVDFRENKVMALIEKLQHHFEVYYNTGLTLITVKNYDEASFDAYRKRAGVLLEQSSRSTLQVLLKL